MTHSLQSGQDDEKSHPPNGSMLQNGNQNGKDPQHSSESNIGNGSPSSSPRRIIAFVGGIDLTGKSKPKCALHSMAICVVMFSIVGYKSR